VRRCGRSVDEDCGGGLDPPSTLKPQGFVDMTHTACTNRSHKAVVRFLPLSVYALRCRVLSAEIPYSAFPLDARVPRPTRPSTAAASADSGLLIHVWSLKPKRLASFHTKKPKQVLNWGRVLLLVPRSVEAVGRRLAPKQCPGNEPVRSQQEAAAWAAAAAAASSSAMCSSSTPVSA
jgi:hypothetical protein